ncbi:hypothetical protein RCL1_005251 [Eukaryota sp. TZLM3-RCL]
MKFVVLLSLLIVVVFAGCRCSPFCGAGYSGSQAACYCFCSNTATSLRLTAQATCTYFPSGSFSSGGCSLCSSQINSNDNYYSLIEKSLDQAAVSTTDSNNEIIFPIRKCVCPNTCGWGYTGTYAQCETYARSQAKMFLGESYSFTYFPSGMFSSGGCSVCGNVHPCRY